MCTHAKFTDERLLQPKGWFKKYATICCLIIAVLLTLTNNNTYAQIAITTNTNAQSLSQLLAGQGVTISNYTRTCDNNGSGTFTNNGTNLGLNQGVVLATGRVTNVPNAANNFASNQFTNSNDAQLSTLTTGTIYDKCILEFDIIPQGNYLKFDYVFASEEYPEFVCSPYNDVFGFFITGPNPGGGNYTNKNIATIPNTTLPVCINSVNPGSSGTYNGTTWNSGNCVALNQTAQYTNNLSPINPQIIYDGMTKKLTAIAAVTPCQSYHLKLAIADVGDRIYDSGVFLEAYSFTSAGIVVSASGQLDYAGYTSAYEGCVGGTFRVSMPAAQATDLYVDVVVTGTATNGVDYTSIPTTVMIPAGQTYVNIDLNPLQDGLTESPESVTVAVVNPCTGLPTSSATLMISDNIPLTATAADTTLCAGQSTQLSATGGAAYTWTPSAGLSNANIANPIATPAVTTNYIVSGTWGSCIRKDTVTVHVSNLATLLTSSPSDTMCSGSTLQISANTTGGTSPYTYIWSTGSVANNVTVTTGGAYRLTITDAEGCSVSATKNVYISNPTVAATATNTTCNGNTGTVSTTLSGAKLPATYIWNDGSTQANRTNLSASTYRVTITDGNGCTASASATVGSNVPTVNVSLSANNVSCFGGNNGSISTTVTGGTSAYSYAWNGGASTANRTGLTAGTYTLTVTDANACSATASAIIAQPAAALAVTASTNNVSCFGGNNGTISTTVTGGTSAYSYAWNGGSSTANRTGLAAGTYTLTVTDANACSATASATIAQPAAALAISTSTSNVSCFGGNNGSISTTVTGGTPAYSYAWNGGASTANRTGLTAGTYTLTVTDANACSATASASIAQPAAALAVSLATSNVSCFGGNNGSISTTVTGGTSAYSYAWNGGATTANRTGLAAGTYTLTVTDANACSATASAVIAQPAAALAVAASTNNVSCLGGNNGSISTTVTGGTSAYSYAWNGGASTANRTGLAAGTYTLTVTDTNACSATASATITQPSAALAIVTSANNVSCFGGNNGSISTTVTGGTSAYSYAWNGGASTSNRTGLIAGTYTLTVTDANACSATTSAVIAQPATALAVAASTNNVSCFGGNNGSITTTVTGGTSAYSYAWNGGVSTANRTGLAAGTYTLTVTDANACSATGSATIAQPAAALAVATSTNNVSCFGGNNGTISTTVTGGTSAYSYAWNGGATSANRTGLTAGTYTLTVTDANACSATASATIAQPAAALAVATSTNNVSCFGGSNGSISTTVTGGTSAYTYAWNGGATSANRTGLTAGTYTLTVTDANACSATASATIAQPAAALAVTTSTNNISCFGGSNGTISTTVTGGTSAYSYAWNGGATSANRTGLAAGTYTLTVTDVNSCSATASATITQPAAALAVAASTNNVSCFAGSNGTISTTVTGGTSAYSYAWNGGATTANRTGLTAGTYTLTVTDANACSATTSATIAQPANALVVNMTKTDATCNGNSTGSANALATGGTLPYTYVWSNNAQLNSNTSTSLPAGYYSVSVTDANNCSANASIEIQQPYTLTATVAKQNVSCNGGNDGSIAVYGNGGTTPYTYTWSHNNQLSSNTSTTLPAGYFTVSVTDANNCSTTISANIIQPNAISIQASVADAKCNGSSDGAINLNVSGGTTPYLYSWNNGQQNSISNSGTLPAGYYTVQVTDGNNCSTTASYTINQPIQLTSTVSSLPTSCYGGNNGSATVSTAGGTAPYSLRWSNNQSNAQATNLHAGLYTVTVTDNNQCTSINSITVAQPQQISIGFTNTNIACNNTDQGAIATTIAGGTYPYSYAWNNGNTNANITNLNTGTYTLTVTDANNCTISSSSSIVPISSLPISILPTNITCSGYNNGRINTSISGGNGPYHYIWSNGSSQPSLQALSVGNYAVTVTDQNSCSATASTFITQPAPIAINTSTTPALCNGSSNGTITIVVVGGTQPYQYDWQDMPGDNNPPNRNNVPAGIYKLTLEDANQCPASAIAQVGEPGPLNSTIELDNPNCFGDNSGNIKVATTGGTSPYNYTWSNGATGNNVTSLNSGTYTVNIADSHNCSVSASVTLQSPNQLLASATHTKPTCHGYANGSIDVDVIGGVSPYNYVWNDLATTQDRTNISSGNYVITVTDMNGCTRTISVALAQPEKLDIQATINNVACYGNHNGSINTNILGGTTPYAYTWNTGETTNNIGSLDVGDYTISVSDSKGCSFNATYTITQPVADLFTSIENIQNTCHGQYNGSITVNATGGSQPYSYHWSTGATQSTLSKLNEGYYEVTITDANGCTIENSAPIIQLPQIALDAAIHNPRCDNGKGNIDITVLSGIEPISYQWNNGNTSQDILQANIGTYNLSATDANGCTYKYQYIVEENTASPFTVYAGEDTLVKLGESVELTATTSHEAISTVWSLPTGLSCTDCNTTYASPVRTTTYTITATDKDGCIATDEVTLNIEAWGTVFTPNAFSPNGDGNNDVWQVYGSKNIWKSINILIFNRWGEKMFETNDANVGWDGMFKGEEAPMAVYVYVVDITYIDGRREADMKGSLTLVR